MKIQIIFFHILFAFLVITPTSIRAEFCIPDQGDINKPYDYWVAVINGLEITKNARDFAIDNQKAAPQITSKTSQKKMDEISENMMIALKTMQQKYDCAISQTASYKNSTNKFISASSGGIDSALSTINNNLKTLTENLIQDLNGRTSKGAGTAASERADSTLAVKNAWEVYSLALIGVTHATLSEANASNSKRHLLITSKERKELIKQLEEKFAKPNKEKDNHVIEVASGLLLEFLKDEWESADAVSTKSSQ